MRPATRSRRRRSSASRRRCSTSMRRHLTGLTTLLPGVREALDTLRRDGIRLGLATNKQQRFIETIFEHFGLSSLFDVVIGGGPGIVKKPAPDMLITAMQQLGVTPSDTVMVGDSTSDVQAARGGGHAVGHRARRLHQRAGRAARRRHRHRRHDRAIRGARKPQAAQLAYLFAARSSARCWTSMIVLASTMPPLPTSARAASSVISRTSMSSPSSAAPPPSEMRSDGR